MNHSHHIIGIGASAGGLEALEHFFLGLNPDVDAAFVVVNHMNPQHNSILSEILSRHTQMAVAQITDNQLIEPKHVYVIPPASNLTIINNRFVLEPKGTRCAPIQIDNFLRALASHYKNQAVAIILSGTGSDGTLGIKAIKENGGLVMVQSPDEAQYEGMPKSAINTGLVDYILGARDLAEQLEGFLDASKKRTAANPKIDDEFIALVLDKVYQVTGHSFAEYKTNTIIRRIERRMAVHEITHHKNYLELINSDETEAGELFEELLIGITHFFRDNEAFESLRTVALPQMLCRNESSQLRVWVPGCSTGEEAYTIAIILRDFVNKHAKTDVNIQIFATDLDEKAITHARYGMYPESIVVDVPEHYLKQYFTKEKNQYKVHKSVRDLVVFSKQDLTKDPPFSRLDLISCRNVLIYFGPQIQHRLIPTFHYMLNPYGLLLLGPSESIGKYHNLFETMDKKWRIFVKKNVATSQHGMFYTKSNGHNHQHLLTNQSGKTEMVGFTPDNSNKLVSKAKRLLLEEFVPPTVIATEDFSILYIQGNASKYLSVYQGEPSNNLLDMCINGLKIALRRCAKQASQDNQVTYCEFNVPSNRADQTEDPVSIRIVPLEVGPTAEKGYMITFLESADQEAIKQVEIQQAQHVQSKTNRQLEDELNELRADLQLTIEDLETSNEELKSANEELQSSNEELQSTNEELETSREELQSLNEELSTVNAELEDKIERLAESRDDMKNLLESTQIGTIFLDSELRIKNYTPEAINVIRLINTDIGRPLADLSSNISKYSSHLAEDCQKVLNSLIPIENTVKTLNDRVFNMRIMPYRTASNVIDGVVLTFVESHYGEKNSGLIYAMREMLQSNNLFILQCTTKGIIQCASHHKSTLTLTGKSLSSLIHELHRQEFKATFNALAESPDVAILDYPAAPFLHVTQTLTINLSPMFDKNNQLKNFSVYIYLQNFDPVH